jgi:hypothetical protein
MSGEIHPQLRCEISQDDRKWPMVVSKNLPVMTMPKSDPNIEIELKGFAIDPCK